MKNNPSSDQKFADKSRAVAQFYYALNQETEQSLTDAQKVAIEQAVDATGLVAKHRIDIRKTFPWFGKRYYFVLLSGLDRRASSRHGESRIWMYLIVSLITLLSVGCIALALLALYLLKSAMGIDLFDNFSLGIWDWFKSL